MKRLFVLLTTLTLLLGLTACGQAGTQSSPDQSQTKQEGTSSEPSAPNQSTPPASSTPEAGEPDEETPEGGVLVAYFSATGNTEGIAQHLQSILDADLYEIVPEVAYTDEDLNYSNDSCRANQEQNDPAARPAIVGALENPEDYDVVFLGYPIWWGQAPKVIYTFLESSDFGDATIVPFCTSGSSGIGSSATNLQSLAPNANWLPGQRFSGSASQDTVASWVEGLELPEPSIEDTQTQLRLTFAGGEAVIVLEDNATTRDFRLSKNLAEDVRDRAAGGVCGGQKAHRAFNQTGF